MSLDAVLTVIEPTGFQLKQGTVVTGGSTTLIWESLSCSGVPGWDFFGGGWDDGWGTSRDLYAIITEGTATNRHIRQLTFQGAKEIKAHTMANTGNARSGGTYDGRNHVTVLDRGAGDRLQGYLLDRDDPTGVSPIYNVDFDTATKKSVAWDGTRMIVGEIASGNMAIEDWIAIGRDTTAAPVKVLPNTIGNGVGIVYNGSRIYAVRSIASGFRVLIQYRDESLNIANLYQQTSTGFVRVDVLAYDGKYLYVGWINDDALESLPPFN